jgi:hypothetical protein
MDVATPQAELFDQLARLGWTLNKVDFKNGAYVARGTGPGKDKAERIGRTPEMAMANLINFAARSNEIRRFAARRLVSAWSSDWLSQSDEIAQAYANMPDFDEKAVPAWRALAAESKIQAEAIRRQVEVEIVDDPEPYDSVKEMCEDVHKNRHFAVSRANSEHPIWTEDDNINFRIVHDVLGHCQSGGTFSWVGENQACSAHMPLVSPLAREALFVESIAQTAYFKHYKGFGNQKVGLLNEFLHPVQEQEGEHIPVPHGGVPQIQSPEVEQEDQGEWVAPEAYSPTMIEQNALHSPHTISSAPHDPDPNEHWTHEPAHPQVNPSDPTDRGRDYIEKMQTKLNAEKIDTHWSEKGRDVQEQAIMNAFRCALLSPLKHLKWNAAHYQALMHMSPKATSMEMWDTLENDRQSYNKEKGFEDHDPWRYGQYVHDLADDLMAQDAHANYKDAFREAKGIVYEKIKEFEKELGGDEEADEATMLKTYLKARTMTGEWLKKRKEDKQQRLPLAESAWKTAAPRHRPTEESLSLEGGDWTEYHDPEAGASGPEREDAKYGGFMSSSLDAIAQIGQRIEGIREVALRDIEETGGKGHQFRSYMMSLGIPYVGAKVISFAWLLLRPLSSDLGIIDAHMSRVLRIPEAPNKREYYKAERMQKAFKNSTGYQHLPLGLYHWGLWDMARSPGTHSDHSALSVLDPEPWTSPHLKWHSDANSSGLYTGPPAFEAGRPHAERAAQEFEEEFAGQRRDQIPQRQAYVKLSERPLREKRRDLKNKLDDFNINLDEHARRLGFYAALQVQVTKKQFEDFLKDQNKAHKSHDANWPHFKKLAIEAFDKWHGGAHPRMWLW